MLDEPNQKNQALLVATCKELGLQEDVNIVATDGFRWSLELVQSKEHPDFGKNMIKLERILQKQTGRPIDLRLEAKEDKNKRQQRNVLWEQPT